MPKICYTPRKFQALARSVIDASNVILEEYEEQGFDLTVRQLFYQFVARDVLPNEPEWYDKLLGIVNVARLAGEIDWNHIVDRTRNLKDYSFWESPKEIIELAARTYKIDMWERQPFYIEVWIEKDALVGLLERPCREYSVPYFSCRGYSSQSEMWRAAQRFIGMSETGHKPMILHLGDHDPSGIDMTRDIQERLVNVFGAEVMVSRIALTMAQIEEYDPPPNPAKERDTRSEGYVAEYGESSWELDALEPSVIENLVQSEIEAYIEYSFWEEDKKRQERERKQIKGLIKGIKK